MRVLTDEQRIDSTNYSRRAGIIPSHAIQEAATGWMPRTSWWGLFGLSRRASRRSRALIFPLPVLARDYDGGLTNSVRSLGFHGS